MKKKLTSLLLCLSIIITFVPMTLAVTEPLTLTDEGGTITAVYSGEE